MYTKILVPLDGSPVAEQVLPYARSLAKALALPVELLRAVEPETVALYSDPKHGRYIDMVEADLKQRSLAYLKNLERPFFTTSRVTCSAKIGKPAAVIVAGAAAQPGTLIAMATHGRSGVQRWLLGSVAEKVLHTAPNHLLLVRATEGTKTDEASLKTVIVPLDGSPVAEKVLHYACDVAKRMDLEVILLRVYALPIMAFSSEDYYTPNVAELLDEAKEEAKRYLEQKVAELKAEGIERISCKFLEGESADQIIEFARKTPDNLIAMCTHGWSGFARILGSVTNRVVRHSGDPVLVVRA